MYYDSSSFAVASMFWLLSLYRISELEKQLQSKAKAEEMLEQQKKVNTCTTFAATHVILYIAMIVFMLSFFACIQEFEKTLQEMKTTLEQKTTKVSSL